MRFFECQSVNLTFTHQDDVDGGTEPTDSFHLCGQQTSILKWERE